MTKDRNAKRIAWLALMLLVYGSIQGLIYIGVIDAFYELTLMRIAIDIMLAMGLDLIIGLSGQFTLGHAGFMSIGAYSCALVTLRMPTLGGFLIGILVGVIVTVIAALIVALPTLRLRGDYLAIATLGFSEIIRMIVVNMESVTNGAAGLSGIPKMTNWTLVFGAIVLLIFLLVHFIQSSPGRVIVAIREDEIAAESVGINIGKYKTIAFVFGASIASIGGAFYASTFNIIRPENFGFMKSVDILIVAVFGGLGSITGTLISATFLGIINVYLQDYGALRMLLYAAFLVIMMIVRPQGLLGRKEFTMTWLFDLFKKDKTPKKGEVAE